MKIALFNFTLEVFILHAIKLAMIFIKYKNSLFILKIELKFVSKLLIYIFEVKSNCLWSHKLESYFNNFTVQKSLDSYDTDRKWHVHTQKI